MLGLRISAHVFPKPHKTSRGASGKGEIANEANYGIAVDIDCVQEPAFLLAAVRELFHLAEMLTHRTHAIGKGGNTLEQANVFEVPHDFVAIADVINIVQGHMEEGLKVIFLPTGRDGGDNLIEGEIDKEFGLGWLLGRITVNSILKENTEGCHMTRVASPFLAGLIPGPPATAQMSRRS